MSRLPGEPYDRVIASVANLIDPPGQRSARALLASLFESFEQHVSLPVAPRAGAVAALMRLRPDDLVPLGIVREVL